MKRLLFILCMLPAIMFGQDTKKGDKFKYRDRTVAAGALEGYQFQRPGSDDWETPKTEAGKRAIHNLFI